jgi:hypothetical protein
MTTASALVFLYSPQRTLAAIAVLNMDDAGDIAAAGGDGHHDFRQLGVRLQSWRWR